MVLRKAAFAAGCFWHVQLAFSKAKGVVNTTAGYMGGNEEKYPNPIYEQVCSDKTGYAETVLVEFNDAKTSYEKLLELFWKEHDPTAVDRQGLDIGTQYRSEIFYYGKKQKEQAEKSKQAIQKKFGNPIVTEIKPAPAFFRAEEYHQNYLQKTGKLVC